MIASTYFGLIKPAALASLEPNIFDETKLAIWKPQSLTKIVGGKISFQLKASMLRGIKNSGKNDQLKLNKLSESKITTESIIVPAPSSQGGTKHYHFY